MRNRFYNADAIWNGGASNPRAVARTLVEAIDEAVEEKNGSAGAKDAACKMILDHLCFLCGLNDMMLDLMRNQEITNAELAALIKRRPMVYERFAGFVGKIVEGKAS